MAVMAINRDYYTKANRNKVLALLEEADVAPDKFTAHRDLTFTARYRRVRMREFETRQYEARIEALDYRLAILKRPSKKIDRGPYITFKFAMADVAKLGTLGISIAQAEPEKETQEMAAVSTDIGKKPEKEEEEEKTSATDLWKRLKRTSISMGHLAQYTHDLLRNKMEYTQLLTVVEELQKQIKVLSGDFEQLRGIQDKAKP